MKPSITEVTALHEYKKSLNKSPKLPKFNTDLKLLFVGDFIRLGKFCWKDLLNILFYNLDDIIVLK